MIPWSPQGKEWMHPSHWDVLVLALQHRAVLAPLAGSPVNEKLESRDDPKAERQPGAFLKSQ